MNDSKLYCWWAYSGKCLRKPCKNCYLSLPVIRGQLDNPNLPTFERERMKQCIYDAFVSKDIKIKKEKKTFNKIKFSKDERERFIKSLKETLKSLT
jgi:hypothetical protein